MTIEQKAKAYDEAIERAKKVNKGEDVDAESGTSLCEYIFPELKESDDERIRKQIISFLKEFEYDHYRNLDFSSWIAWLEKQDEQKPTDEVKPKFNVGEWIVWQDKCYKVNYNGCGYELVDQNGLSTSLEYGTVDKNAHLWTINNAKPGDVLVSEVCDAIILFKGIKDNNIDFYCDYDFSEIDSEVDVTKDRFAVNSGDEHYGSVEDAEDFHPATKEQRDTLMQAMTNAGWQFDFEKKELKKNDQNSAWSDEDEDAIGMAIIAPEDMYDEDAPNTTYGGYNLPFNKAAERLKLLKDRVILQSKQEWSEEDEKMFIYALDMIEWYSGKNEDKTRLVSDWLKSIKNKIIGYKCRV